MSANESKPRNLSTLAFAVWLAALVVFIVLLLLSLRKLDAEVEPQSAPISLSDTGYILDSLAPYGQTPAPIPGFDVDQTHVLVGFGQQGLYQTVSPDSDWVLTQPGQFFNAQLIERGPKPAPVTDGVSIAWSLAEGSTLAGANADALQGVLEIAADGRSFSANIPVTAYRADGELNPYPLLSLTATGADGQILAQSAAVLAVSPGYGCGLCHGDANQAVLAVHDRREGTNFVERSAAGELISCRNCHTGLSAVEGQLYAGGGLSVSAAVHGWHSNYLANLDQESCLHCHIGLAKNESDGDLLPRPVFARDFHIERGLNCVRCHGYLEDHALALLKPEQEAGQPRAAISFARITPRTAQDPAELNGRLPWVQEPDCASCHDFIQKPDLLYSSAFNKWTDNSQQALFSQRFELMAKVRCATCHGAPHAVYRSNNPLNADLDNIPPQQYQEWSAPLGAWQNCNVCHGQSMPFFIHHGTAQRSRTEIHVPESAMTFMPIVQFSHQAHAILDCTTCHHTGRQDGTSLLCTSSGCHDMPTPGPKDAGGSDLPEYRYFRMAFHGEDFSCNACHAKRQAEGLPAGPTGCPDCHRAPSARWTS